MQADGVRRYQYNERLTDVLATIPRGTVFDRRGLPLATGDPAIARHARDAYKKAGVEIAGCATAHAVSGFSRTDERERCYPLGGAAFHLLGDVRDARNWAATNTAYVERDAQDHLRGFDDHATTVTLPDASGRPVQTTRRDFHELVPLLRHRYSPNHSDVKAFLNRTRDVTLTIDAPLQAAVARILSKYAARSATGHAAAVVLNPDTGELLAVGSYPFPSVTVESAASRRGRGRDADRSRAIRALPAGFDVQARHRGRGAASEPGVPRVQVHVLAAGQRTRRRTGRRHNRPRRRARRASARTDRHARRPRAVVQCLLRAARGSRRPASHCSTPRTCSASRSRATSPSHVCAIRCRRLATARATSSRRRCAWRAWRRRSRAAGSCARSGSRRRRGRGRRRTHVLVSRRRRSDARPLSARLGAHRHRPQSARAPVAHRRQDRHRRSAWRAVARLVRRLRAVRCGREARRVRGADRERRLRRCGRGACGWRDRHCRRSERVE